MTNELAWVPELLAGKTIADVGDALEGDLLGEDFKHAWKSYADTAAKAAEQTLPHRVVHLSHGNSTTGDYLAEVTGDILIHTWDLAKGAGIPFHIEEKMAQEIYDRIVGEVEGWRKAGLVGPEVPVGPAAGAEDHLLGLMGRQP
jgi:hypothetical protein